MPEGRNTKLTGAIGEFLVSAALCRLGLMATPFSGNVPHYDIIASDVEGGHLVIQVKAINKTNWQFDARKFVDISIHGERQKLGIPKTEPYPNLYCVFVALGERYKDDRYFIFSWHQLRDTVIQHHQEYLNKYGGVRPRSPKSTHCSISISELESFEGSWKTILSALKNRD